MMTKMNEENDYSRGRAWKLIIAIVIAMLIAMLCIAITGGVKHCVLT